MVSIGDFNYSYIYILMTFRWFAWRSSDGWKTKQKKIEKSNKKLEKSTTKLSKTLETLNISNTQIKSLHDYRRKAIKIQSKQHSTLIQ